MSSSGIAKYIDKYEVLGEVGRGAMGGVYKALHPHLRKYVAIKEINCELAGQAEVRRRFELEAEVLARIPPHPNIVMVRDAFVWLGQLYLVMDYVEGGTLKDLLKERISLERSVEMLEQILSALEAVHRSGVVHMDLKPANILIDRQGAPHITDFGVAECVGRERSDCSWGTAKYVAPELIIPSIVRGSAAAQVDIYSLGIIAYEMLLGQRRFCEEFSEVYNTHAEDRVGNWIAWHTDQARVPRNLNDIDPSIPRAIANLVERMMAKDPKARYGSVSDASRDLVSWFAAGRDIRGRRIGPPRDDVTVPLDQLRAGGSRSPRERSGQPAGPQPESAGSQQRSPGEPSTIGSSPGPPSGRGGGGFPMWGWLAGLAAALLLIMVVALGPLLFASPGFTLVVQGAPPGSDVFVDGTLVGMPVSDGTIRAFGLDASRERSVLVRCPGGGEYKKSISSADGEVYPLEVGTDCNQLPAEIELGETTMVLVDAGEFVLGDDNHESDEKPSQRIAVDAFYIDKFEVTNEEYKAFRAARGGRTPTETRWHQDYFNNPNYAKSPVLGVTWNDANDYAIWKNKRLPTEKEWEKAASWGPKASKKNRWPWGDEQQPDRAALNASYPSAVGAHPRGASGYGVHDMAGNAAEWVSDFYNSYPGNPDPSSSSYGTEYRVTRGGSFSVGLDKARTTYRLPRAPNYGPGYVQSDGEIVDRSFFGFRCAISANDPAVQEAIRKRTGTGR